MLKKRIYVYTKYNYIGRNVYRGPFEFKSLLLGNLDPWRICCSKNVGGATVLSLIAT